MVLNLPNKNVRFLIKASYLCSKTVKYLYKKYWSLFLTVKRPKFMYNRGWTYISLTKKDKISL